MNLRKRVDQLRAAACASACPACADAPTVLLVKDERDVLPSVCVRCGRAINCFTVIGVTFEQMGLPPELLAEMKGRVERFHQRQGLA